MEEERQQHFQRLLREVEGGSEAAAQELYETYVKHVLRCVRHRMWHQLRRRFDSQDFVQQVWASFFDERGRLPEFATPEDLANYLMTIAQHKVWAAGRQERARKRDAGREEPVDEAGETTETNPAGRDPTPSAVAVYREEYDRMVDRQPAEVREVAELRVQGSTFDEIAEELEMDESTARKVMRRLKRALLGG